MLAVLLPALLLFAAGWAAYPDVLPGGLREGIDPTYDCEMRQLAYEYGQQLQPNQGDFSSLFDALELSTLCGVSQPTRRAGVQNERLNPVRRHHKVSLYVDYAIGDDDHDGSLYRPFRTILAAVVAARRRTEPTEIVLREGFHFVNQTIELGPQDSDLLFINFPNETAVVSGGIPLETDWVPYFTTGFNIYVADVASANLDDVVGLQLYTTPGQLPQRGIRARFPNSDPEYVPVVISGGATWLPPTNPTCNSTVIHQPLPQDYPGMFQDYYLGVDGFCNVYEVDPTSYWCQPNGRTAGSTYCARFPQGMVYEPSALPNAPYANPAGAVVSAWRGNGAWFNWFWEVASYDAETQTVIFGRGGFQGGEGSSSADLWYVENVFEELDWPTEFFYNRTTKQLYYFNNGTGAPSPSVQFVSTNLETIFNISGTAADKVSNIGFSGLTFSTTARTDLAPHGVPSGGDWGLERLGAIVIQNAVGVTIDSCLFSKLDGNAIMLNGYNRDHVIQGNEFEACFVVQVLIKHRFVFIGNNAMASWGYTNYSDGTNGDQPYNTSVLFNLIHEIGHYEKQSSAWFQAKSALNTLVGNIAFNMPRAAINFNDGFGGGNNVSESLLFNTCRESTDHGAINSWDRVPFFTTVLNGSASLVPAYNNIFQNFIVTNYGADGGCVDNDDGSSYYNLFNNYCVYGGHKSDFDGHNKRSFGNYHIYPFVYETTCFNIQSLPIEGTSGEFNEAYYNNTCVLPSAGNPYWSIGVDCSSSSPIQGFTMTMGNNRLYAPSSDVTIQCSGSLTFSEFEAFGQDPGTQLFGSPNITQMIQWGHDILNML